MGETWKLGDTILAQGRKGVLEQYKYDTTSSKKAPGGTVIMLRKRYLLTGTGDLLEQRWCHTVAESDDVYVQGKHPDHIKNSVPIL